MGTLERLNQVAARVCIANADIRGYPAFAIPQIRFRLHSWSLLKYGLDAWPEKTI
jgi:hypothetical protein